MPRSSSTCSTSPGALPVLRAATLHDLNSHGLHRGRVTASAVRLIDLGLFRIGGERYAELDHHYGVATLENGTSASSAMVPCSTTIAKEGKRRAITVTDPAVFADGAQARPQRQRPGLAVLLGGRAAPGTRCTPMT